MPTNLAPIGLNMTVSVTVQIKPKKLTYQITKWCVIRRDTDCQHSGGR
jgi:hypothetical protein